jgi:hypothetical protein
MQFPFITYKTTMKTLSFISFILFTLFQMQANAKSYVSAEPCTVGVCINIAGEIGIKTQGCKKIGLSCFDISLGVTTDMRNFNNPPVTGKTTLLLTKISATQLEIAFRTNQTGPMVIDMPIALGATLSRALGSSSITIKPGTYSTIKRADGAMSAIVSIY